MDIFIQGLAIIASLVAIGVLGYARKLAKQVHQLNRDKHDIEQKFKMLPKEMANIIEPMRLQLAAVARGKTVSEDLIRDGCLYRNISAVEAETTIAHHIGAEQHDLMLIDVRTTREYARGHMPGARLIPMEEIEKRYKAEIPTTGKAVLVYCDSGERSRLACDYLSRHGYFNLYNMKDGLQRWKGALESAPKVSLVQIESKTRTASTSEAMQR